MVTLPIETPFYQLPERFQRFHLQLGLPVRDATVLYNISQLYLQHKYGKFALSPSLAFRNCAVLNVSFCRFLRRFGVVAEIVELGGAPFYPDADPRWQNTPETLSRANVNHFVAQYTYKSVIASDNRCMRAVQLDWSYRQFAPSCELPHLQTMDESGWQTQIRVLGRGHCRKIFTGKLHHWKQNNTTYILGKEVTRFNATEPVPTAAELTEKALAAFKQHDPQNSTRRQQEFLEKIKKLEVGLAVQQRTCAENPRIEVNE